MQNQDPKDQKPLSDKDLEQATGGAVGIESGGGGGDGSSTAGATSSTDVDPGLAASGMDPETYYAIFPASRPLPNTGPQ